MSLIYEEELPFMYKDPLNMFVYWMCDRDEEGKLVSVFVNDENERETHSVYLTEEEALTQKKYLIHLHWQKMPKPEINIQTTTQVKDSKLLPGERKSKNGQPTTKQRLRALLEKK